MKRLGLSAALGLAIAMVASAAFAADRPAKSQACPAIAAFEDGKFIAGDKVQTPPGALLERAKRAKTDRRELERLADMRLRPGRASIVITTWSSLIPGRTVTVARRNLDGTWSVVEVRDSDASVKRSSDPDLVVKKGTIGKAGAQRLNDILADPCLSAEPVYIANEYPLVDGGEGGCFDGGDTLVEIVLPGRRRTAFNACIPYGLNVRVIGEIGKALN